MKAITLWQPWASLIALGLKTIETRSWDTNYRGDLYIHAAKKIVPFEVLFNDMPTRYKNEVYMAICKDYGSYENMPTGEIIAKTNLVDCLKIAEEYKILKFAALEFKASDQDYEFVSGDEYHFGDYTPGRYGWILNDTQTLENPIPAKGMQRLWNFNI